VLWWVLYKAERVLSGSWLRSKALDEIMTHIHYEDENTRYVDIGPVNKVWGREVHALLPPQHQLARRLLPAASSRPKHPR
jgi:cycloartenol synthase